jgi:hypothetical protein
MLDAAAAFAPGDRVLLRDQPLLGPLIVDHVRMFFAGEPETNGPVWAWHDGGRAPACELVPCPPGYEPAPPADNPRLTLRWINRNRLLLEAVHGIHALESAEQHVRHRIIRDERIETALAAEPEATAIRRAEIAMGAPALGEIFTMDEFVRSERQ